MPFKTVISLRYQSHYRNQEICENNNEDLKICLHTKRKINFYFKCNNINKIEYDKT